MGTMKLPAKKILEPVPVAEALTFSNISLSLSLMGVGGNKHINGLHFPSEIFAVLDFFRKEKASLY